MLNSSGIICTLPSGIVCVYQMHNSLVHTFFSSIYMCVDNDVDGILVHQDAVLCAHYDSCTDMHVRQTN